MWYLLATDPDTRKSELQGMNGPWSVVNKPVSGLKTDECYIFKTDPGEPAKWFVFLVQMLASKNVAGFSSIRKKLKRRQVPCDPNRPRHRIACASRVSKELADFLGLDPDEKIARTVVISKLIE